MATVDRGNPLIGSSALPAALAVGRPVVAENHSAETAGACVRGFQRSQSISMGRRALRPKHRKPGGI